MNCMAQKEVPLALPFQVINYRKITTHHHNLVRSSQRTKVLVGKLGIMIIGHTLNFIAFTCHKGVSQPHKFNNAVCSMTEVEEIDDKTILRPMR